MVWGWVTVSPFAGVDRAHNHIRPSEQNECGKQSLTR